MEEIDHGQEVGKNVAHAKLIFALIIAAVFLDVVDFSIVQVALPSIQNEFFAPLADVQWVIGAYGITTAGFLMLSGRAGDIYGQKKLFISGIILFVIASFTGGLAPSLLFLIISRAVQGIGAAITTVTAFALFIELFPEGRERNKALGIFVAVLSAGFAAGAVSGGFLTGTFGWRSVMFINVPIGIAAAILLQKYLPSSKGRLLNAHLDLPGAMTVTTGLILLVYVLTNAANVGFSSLQTILPLASSLFILAGFVAIESRSKAPLMPLSFLRRGTILTANILGLVLASTIVGISFIITIYLQQILGYSPFYAGLGSLPGAMIFFIVGGWGASRFVNRYGVRKTLVMSTILITIGTALLLTISANGNYFGILPGMIVWALGASIGFPALNIAALSGTKPGEEGLASGLINTSTRIGFPLGLAVLLTIATVMTPAQTASGIVTGFRYALIVAATLGLLGVFIASRIKETPKNTGEVVKKH